MATPPNNLGSNTTKDLLRKFMAHFESSRVVTKTVNTQLIQGKFTPRTGGEVAVKRPTMYRSLRTSGGDISALDKSPIIAGQATAVVQDYITVPIEWDDIEEALELDQLDELLAPAARRIVTDLEVSLSNFMMINSGLSSGTVGTSVTTWSDVASFASLMKATGVPSDKSWFAALDPFTVQNLADAQGGLSSGDNSLVNTAWENAQISRDFGGMRAIMSNSLSSYTTDGDADRVGALNSNPDVTYVTAKDTMLQTLVIKLVDTTLTVVPGDVVEITGVNRVNVDNHLTARGASGAAIPWRATVVTGGVASGGVVTVVVAGPAIFSSTDTAYNTVDRAPVTNDVVTILGAASTVLAPNLFYHPDAFGLATVKLPKLAATDTTATTSDGMSIRVTEYSDGDSNKHKIRFDLLPAFVVFNPLMAGTGWG